MKRRKELLLAGAVALGLTGAALAAGSGGGEGGWDRHCDGDQSLKVEMMTLYVGEQLDLTEAQMPAWDAAVEAVNAASDRRQAMCDEMAGVGEPATIVDALERAETRMQSGLETVSDLKDAVGNLYDVLDEGQRATLDDLARNFRHMRG